MDTTSGVKSNTQSSIKDDIQSSNNSAKSIQDISYTKRQKIIRAVLDSYLRGCLIGNLVEKYRGGEEKEISEQIFSQIIKGDFSGVPQLQGKELNIDITWHYLFFAEIYTLLEYDSFLTPEILNFDSYMKYLIVMINTSNSQTKEQLKNIIPKAIQLPPNETPHEQGYKYVASLQCWHTNQDIIQEKQQSGSIMKANLEKKTHLKLTISKIIPALFIYSTNSLKIPVEKVAIYLKKFSYSEEHIPLAFYFVFMNKLMKYYLKENNIQKALTKIKLKLKDKKKYLSNGKMNTVIKRFEKKLEKLKQLQKDRPKFQNINETSPEEIKQEYSNSIFSLKKKKDYAKFEQLVVDIIFLLIGFLSFLDHDSIIFKMSQLIYENTSIPAILLTYPVLAVRYPEKYLDNQNQQTYKIYNQDCLLNYCKPDPWFSTLISNQIFTEFVNLFSERFYRTSK